MSERERPWLREDIWREIQNLRREFERLCYPRERKRVPGRFRDDDDHLREEVESLRRQLGRVRDEIEDTRRRRCGDDDSCEERAGGGELREELDRLREEFESLQRELRECRGDARDASETEVLKRELAGLRDNIPAADDFTRARFVLS